MKQSSLDIAMNMALNAICEAPIVREDKQEILDFIKLSFLNYKGISNIQKERIEHFNQEEDRKTR